MWFLGFVPLVGVCPASSERILLPQGYELRSLLSILSVGESHSWPRMGSSCVRLLPGYYKRVRLTPIVGTSCSDPS